MLRTVNQNPVSSTVRVKANITVNKKPVKPTKTINLETFGMLSKRVTKDNKCNSNLLIENDCVLQNSTNLEDTDLSDTNALRHVLNNNYSDQTNEINLKTNTMVPKSDDDLSERRAEYFPRLS